MRISKPVKSWGMKAFTVTLLAVFLFSTSTLTAVLTQQKAVEATQRQASTWSTPYSEQIINLLRNLKDYQNFTDAEKALLLEYFGIGDPLADDELLSLIQNGQIDHPLSKITPFDLVKGRVLFDTVSIDDWVKLEPYLSNLSFAEVQALISKGVPANDIYQINWIINTGMFSLSEAEILVGLYPIDGELTQQLFDFYIYTFDSARSVQTNAKALLLSGVGMDTIKETLKLEISSSLIASIRSGGIHDIDYDPIAPFSVNNSSSERVDLNSGNLSYRHNILSIPGINGLDLNLSLVYNSTDSAVNNVVAYYGSNGGYVIGTTARDDKNCLGFGWNWNLPYIDADVLHLGDSQSYAIGYLNTTTKIYDLINHTLQDFVLKQSITYPNGLIFRCYVLEYMNGDTFTFNSDGLLISQKDRYGNTITYKYTKFNYQDVLSQIVDTAGRVVNISYSTSSYSKVRTIVVKAPDNSQTTITVTDIFSPYNCYAIETVTDAKGNQTHFSYTIGTGAFNPLKDVYFYYPPANYSWLLLTKVVYPTQAKKVFTYDMYTDNFGDYGIYEFYRLSGRQDVIGSTNYNIKTYDYEGSSTGNGEYAPDYLPSDYTYSATITDSSILGSTICTYYEFDCDHLMTNENIEHNNALIALTAYEYNADRLPISITSQVYNSSSSFMESILLYEYDNKGNITDIWDERANGDINNIEFQTSFTYDNYYFNLLTSKTYMQDDYTVITELYTPTNDHKSISMVEIWVNGLLQAATQFSYNSRGEIYAKYDYLDDFVQYITTSYSYDVYGNLTSIVNTSIMEGILYGTPVTGTLGPGYAPGRLATSFAYDIMSRVIIATDAVGNATAFQYDVLGRKTKIVNADNTFTTNAYDDANNVLTTTDEIGNQLKYYYDGFGNLLRIYDVKTKKNLTTNTYDAKMRLSSTDNHNNSAQSAKTSYTYDYFDRVLTIETRDKNNVIMASEMYAYDDAAENGQFSKVTHTIIGDVNAPSIVSSTYLNKSGLLEKQSRTLNNVEYFDYFTYDYLGNLLTEKTAIAVQNYNQVPCTAQYEYDYAGRVTKQYNIAGDYATFGYDTLGRLIYAIDYAGNVSYYEYDNLGRLLAEGIPFEEDSSDTYYFGKFYCYDGNGNVIRVQTTNNQLGTAYTFTTAIEYQYNSRNQLTMVIQYDGSTYYCTEYTYYENGLMESMYDYNTSGELYFYDHMGRVTEKWVISLSYDTYNYIYDTNGNLILAVDRNGWVTTFTYDGLGRLLSMNVNTGNPTTDCYQVFTYTLTGAIKSENNGNFSATYTYDALGRLITVNESNNVLKTYTYDIADNRTSYVLKVNNVTQVNTAYTYDYFNRLETVKENNSPLATYTYDINGNRASLTYANGTSETYTYNLANMVTSVINASGSTVISSYAYTYYLDGNQHTKTDHAGKVTTYVYDEIGRLVSEEEKIGGVVVQSYYYTYDLSNNRATMVATGVQSFSISYTYDFNNLLLTETKNSVVTTYTYDNNGNQLSQSTSLQINTFVYNGLNQLISANMGGTVATYSYDAKGLRISKTVGGTTTKHVWDGSNISLELNSSNVVTAKYLRGLNLLASEANSVRTYFLYNAHGDVIQLTNSGGTVTKSYEYDAFGVEKSPNPSDANSFRYCGEYYDKETENYYLRARYYNPTNARWLSPDTHWNPGNMIYGDNPVKNIYYKDAMGLSSYVPNILAIMQSGNLYAYCGNNPVMYADPTGEFLQLAITAFAVQALFWIGVACIAYAVGTIAYYVIVDGVAKLADANKFKPITLNPAAGSPSIVTRPNTMNATRGIANVVSQPVSVANMQTKTKNFGTYQFAYLDSKGNLVKTGPQMNIAEAYYALRAMPLKGSFGGQSWGLYTSSQADAQAFALLYGLVHHSDLALGFDAEYHGNNYYGHYHVNHIVGKEENSGVHIWFGNTLKW